MATYTILPQPRTVFLDNNSIPLAGGMVYTYIPPNTTTLKTTYQDAAGATPNTNPIILDGEGSCLLYGTGQYLLALHDAAGNLIWTGLSQDLYALITTSANTFTAPQTFTSNVSLGALATATTQPASDVSNLLATDAFVATAIAAASPVPFNIISGFLPSSMTGSTTTAAITISSGQAADSTNAKIISNINSISWTVTNGNAINGYSGGTTLPSSATLHMYACLGSSGIGSYLIPNSSYPLSAINAPTGYNQFVRRVFSFNTASSSTGPIPYVPLEVEGGAILAWLATQVLDINTSSQGSSRIAYGLTVPSGIKVEPIGRYSGSASEAMLFTSGDETDVAQSAAGIVFTTAPGADFMNNGTCTIGINTYLTTNTAGQIGARSSTPGVSLYWVTRGFKDWRRN